MSLRRCPHCDRILWDRAPRLREIADFLKKARKEMRSTDIAKRFGLNIANASNAVRALEDSGLVRVRREPHPQGGAVKVIRWTGETT